MIPWGAVALIGACAFILGALGLAICYAIAREGCDDCQGTDPECPRCQGGGRP